MNNFNSFFDNLLPLRPLFPFVQSVLPTVFDDSLSYLETLGKVVKALNDTESNVNTLEQAVRAFAVDLAHYENLSITPVEITFNNDTGRYTASMTYADIVSAIQEGHTMVMRVVDGLHNTEYYTATMKVAETSGGVKVLYWESPAFTVNDVTVFYEPFINENDTVGVTTRTITGSGGGVDTFIIHYDSDTETADKTFAEIVAAIEAEKPVALIADRHYIGSAMWTTTGNDEQGYEIISVAFTIGSVVSAQNGYNLGVVTYAVNNANTWSVDRHGFPDVNRVNALISAQLDGLELQHAVQYIEQNLTQLEKAQARSNIAAGHYNIGVSADETLLTLMDLATNTVETYNINKGASFLVTVSNPSPNVFVVNRSAADIRANLFNLRLRYGLNEGVDINSYEVYGSPPMHSIRFVVVDPNTTSVSYTEFILQVYQEGYVPADPAQDVVTVTRNLITHNIGAGSLPDTTNASAGDILKLDSNKNAVWADGNKPRVSIAADSASIPALSPNTLYVFTGDAVALNITLAMPANNNVENEYHFIFNSGSTPTTLTLPNTIRQPDGFTVEANHVYEVSILENNMTAQGWAVSSS